MYLPMTSELSVGYSSSESSARPSRKRCRSPAATVTSSIYATRALVPSRANLLPLPKRFRDSILPEDSVEEDIDMDVLEDIEVDATTVEVEVDVKAGIDAVRKIRRFRYYGRMRFRRLETFNMTITRSGMTPEAIEELVNRRVEDALAAYEATRDENALEAKSQIQNDGDNGNGGNGNGGNGNSNENDRCARPVARECTYQDFMKCQPLNFKGAEGVFGLISALTWWNSHKRTIGADAAFAMSWRELMKLMAEVYCPRNEIQKMESELWNLTVKNNDLAAYTQRFQELTMMCTKMVPKEEDRVEKFIGGLPDNIQGNVIAAEPTRLQDAV
ncbi:putative reverse transcriptase domain-containing protein [Tanacetum coccineum]